MLNEEFNFCAKCQFTRNGGCAVVATGFAGPWSGNFKDTIIVDAHIFQQWNPHHSIANHFCIFCFLVIGQVSFENNLLDFFSPTDMGFPFHFTSWTRPCGWFVLLKWTKGGIWTGPTLTFLHTALQMDATSAATITFNFFAQFDGPGLQNIWLFLMLKDQNHCHGNLLWKHTQLCLAEPLTHKSILIVFVLCPQTFKLPLRALDLKLPLWTVSMHNKKVFPTGKQSSWLQLSPQSQMQIDVLPSHSGCLLRARARPWNEWIFASFIWI